MSRIILEREENCTSKKTKMRWFMEDYTFIVNSDGTPIAHFKGDVEVTHYTGEVTLSVITQKNTLLMYTQSKVSIAKYRTEFIDYIVNNIKPDEVF